MEWKEERITEFKKLFEPGNIGKLQLKNRIIMPPMITRYVNDDGSISDRTFNYYGERARGECAMVTIEPSYPRSGGYPGESSSAMINAFRDYGSWL
jgi:2,4-dienoyl-CoA reductase-like NADH-dependent reductase (Old Yellow Enzyme family)